MVFRPYFSPEINDNITSAEVDQWFRAILSSNSPQLNYHITDFNTRLELVPGFNVSHDSVVIRKAILYQQRELQRIALEASQTVNPLREILGIAGSIALGAFIGEKLASGMRVGVDLDEVHRLLGK